MTAPTPRASMIYDAHEYTPVSAAEDPHGHGTDCDCSPRCVCGSAKDAFIHHEEARDAGTVLVVPATAVDAADARETHQAPPTQAVGE